jgi:hypothetical protein
MTKVKCGRDYRDLCDTENIPDDLKFFSFTAAKCAVPAAARQKPEIPSQSKRSHHGYGDRNGKFDSVGGAP